MDLIAVGLSTNVPYILRTRGSEGVTRKKGKMAWEGGGNVSIPEIREELQEGRKSPHVASSFTQRRTSKMALVWQLGHW